MLVANPNPITASTGADAGAATALLDQPPAKPIDPATVCLWRGAASGWSLTLRSGMLVIELSGHLLDEPNATTVRDFDLLLAKSRGVVLDLADLEHISSAALGTLLAWRRQASLAGIPVVATRPGRRVADILRICGVADLIAA